MVIFISRMYMSVLNVYNFDSGGDRYAIGLAHNAGQSHAYDEPVFKKKRSCGKPCILKTGYCSW
jgi:hypothetical protein